jgi:hypothetical protein
MIHFAYIFLVIMFIGLVVYFLKNRGKMARCLEFKVLLICECEL